MAMPIYEYRCENNHTFDLFQPVGAPPPACPTCGRPSRKVYNSVGLIFKGPGFHTTDYRRSSSGGTSGDGKDGKQEAGAKASSGEAGGKPAETAKS